MKLFRSYLLNEVCVPFCVALLIFTFIFIVGNLVKMADLIINKGVGILDILRIVVLLVPPLLSFTIPMAALTAIVLVFGTMAQHNEIIAMKASGVNIFKAILPIILASFVLSLCSLVMNDQILPKTHYAYRKALKNVLVKKPLAYLEAGRFIKEFAGYVIFVREIEDDMLKNITIYQPQDDKPTRTIIAERGEILTDPQTKTLSLKLYNGTSDEPHPDNPNVFYKLDFETFVLPPFTMNESAKISKKTKDMTIDELVREMKTTGKKELIEADFLYRLKAEIHKKIAFSFAPLVFVLIGLPLALITRRGDAVISFGISLIVITVYYVMFVWANTIAIQGTVPPWVVLWMPNVLIALAGVVLIRKVVNT